MPSWLIDDPSLVYLVLGLIAFALGVGLWMNRGEEEPGSMGIRAWLQALKRRRLTRNQTYAFGLTIVAVLAIAVWLIGRVGITDAKRIRLALEEMAAGVEEKNFDKIFKHVSEKFDKKLMNKKAMRQKVEHYVRSGGVTRVVLWGIEKPVFSEDRTTATIKFGATAQGYLVMPEGGLSPGNRCKATFVRDSDGEWRLLTFKVFLISVDPDRGDELELPW
jgi:hypothetical protein